jgi:hypothetical protein
MKECQLCDAVIEEYDFYYRCHDGTILCEHCANEIGVLK